MKLLTRIVAMSWIVALATRVEAQVPQALSYQGVLTDNLGQLVADGNYSITFRLFNVVSGGASLYTEVQNPVAVSKGGFSVLIGSVTPLTLAFDIQYWLEVQVGVDPPLAPRIKLSSAAYALNARTVVNDAIGSAQIATGAVTTSEILDNTITSADILNGTVASTDVADESLTAGDLLSEPGVASASTTTDNTLNTLAENLTSSVITLPASGFVVALGTANIQLNHAAGVPSEANLSINTTSATHDTGNLRAVRLSSSLANSGTYRHALAVQDVFFFPAAGPQTLFLVGSAPFGVGQSAVETSLVLMYLPTAYGSVLRPVTPQAAAPSPTR